MICWQWNNSFHIFLAKYAIRGSWFIYCDFKFYTSYTWFAKILYSYSSTTEADAESSHHYTHNFLVRPQWIYHVLCILFQFKTRKKLACSYMKLPKFLELNWQNQIFYFHSTYFWKISTAYVEKIFFKGFWIFFLFFNFF